MAINITRTAAVTTEQVISDKRCRLLLVIPEVVTTGTLTLRNGEAGEIKHIAAIGVPQTGKVFGNAQFEDGLTIEQSVGTDRCAIVWEAV
jgi:hypothetical protein